MVSTDYMAHGIPKEILKNSHFENMVFFIGVKTDFGEIPLKSYIFRHDKN